MGVFDDREQASEANFARKEAQTFQLSARRNKLLGQWAADMMGLEAAEVKAYIQSLLMADLEEAGDEDVFRKVRQDFDAADVSIPDTVLRDKMKACMKAAQNKDTAS